MTDHPTIASPEASATPPQPSGDEPAIDSERADAFAAAHPVRPIPAQRPVDTRPICETPSASDFLDPVWKAVVEETRARGNDIHLPISVAYAERLCDAYPTADREVVLVATLLHDTGWAHVDESRILSEGFTGDWRKAQIRYEHEHQGCIVARRVLPGLGYAPEFVERITAIIEGHDTRHVAYSIEDALVRDADRAWRFDRAGIALASSWFGMDPATYADRLAAEIVPELITAAAVEMATADLARSNALLKTGVLR